MKRIFSLVVTAVLFGAQANAADYEWRMATIAPSETSAYFRLFAKPLAENVKKLTNGKVEIRPYPAGVLAPAFEIHDAVRDGRADVGNAFPGYLVNQNAANSLLSAHPGGLGADAFMAWIYSADGQQLWQEFRREEMGLFSVVAGAHPSEIHLQSKRAVRVVDDLKGLKVRAAGAAAAILAEFGAAPVSVPGGEVFVMLERGAIEATEYSTPADNVTMGFTEIVPYVITPGVHSPSVPFEFIMDAAAWDALPEDVKEQVQAAAKLTTLEAYYAWLKEDLSAMAKLREQNNVEIIQVDQSYIDAWATAGRRWIETAGAGNEWAERISTSYYNFLDSWADDTANLVYNR